MTAHFNDDKSYYQRCRLKMALWTDDAARLRKCADGVEFDSDVRKSIY